MIVKVEEPIDGEFDLMHENQVLFTYLHLAADKSLTEKLLKKGSIGIAYETIQTDRGSLPLLAPMSAVAGRLSIQAGAYCLEAKNGGRGILLSGVPGVKPATVVIMGAVLLALTPVLLRLGAGLGSRSWTRVRSGWTIQAM
jgi:alanine dehydrogenase